MRAAHRDGAGDAGPAPLPGILWEPLLDGAAARWRDVAREETRRTFAPTAATVDAAQEYPLANVVRLRESGLATLFLPSAHGGGGAGLLALAAATEEVARGCASTAAIISALQLGAFPILLGGTPAQRDALLGSLVHQGHAICFALSEDGAGSDAAAIETTATEEAGGWRLRGEKRWLGNGWHSVAFVVFARTGERAISAFLVPREAPGVAVDRCEDKMGIRGTTTTNLRLDVRVPADAMVGVPGAGLRLALSTLNVGRVVIAAQACGLARAAFDAAARIAASRRSMGQPLLAHQGIGFRLADAATELSAARMMLFEAARAYDAGADIAVLGAMAKLHASEVSHRVVDTAVQVHGGLGYVKPSLVERAYRDQRITEIYEGTSEIQRLVIARAIQRAAA